MNYNIFEKIKRFQKPIIAVLFVVILVTGTLAPIGPSGVQEAEALFWIPLIIIGSIYYAGTEAVGVSPISSTISYGISKVAEVGADSALGKVISFLTGFIQSITGWFMNLTGTLLDLSIGFTTSSSNLKLDSVIAGWAIVRDVANMTFIFILLYIGLMTILQLSSFQTRKTLVKLVLVALFVNFSSFIAGFIIDIANILGSFFYSMILDLINAGDASGGHTISTYLVKELHIESVLNMESADIGVLMMGTLIGAVVQIIAAFVFLSTAMLFFIRTIYLMFLIILSPLAFVAAILPNTARYFKEWVSSITSQSFVYPIFMLMMLITIRILESDDITDQLDPDGPGGIPAPDLTFQPAVAFKDPEIAGAVTQFETFAVFVPYMLVLGFLIGSMAVSKRVAGNAATMAGKMAGMAVGAGAGALAFGGRRVIGGAANEVANSKRVSQWAQNSKAIQYGQRQALNLSKSSFDVRGGAAGTGLRSLSGFGGVGSVGKAGGQGGYKKQFDDKVKAQTDYAKDLAARKTYEDEDEETKAVETELGKKEDYTKNYKSSIDEKRKETEYKLSHAENEGNAGEARKLKAELSRHNQTLSKSDKELREEAEMLYDSQAAKIKKPISKANESLRKKRVSETIAKPIPGVGALSRGAAKATQWATRGRFKGPSGITRKQQAISANVRKDDSDYAKFKKLAKDVAKEDESSAPSTPTPPPAPSPEPPQEGTST